MTSEERMIRVTRDDFYEGGSDDGFLKEDFPDINWKFLEPAPPKDWKPFCYGSDGEHCFECHFVDDYFVPCPYRKRD
jgi:hypothetical protein